ncbi:hypothetical protein CLU79DRAFT_772783 [Phycomyces nitens]|nr:hypothetical protein CLU79DRAFT_772783 [Phycomyces nitens]
MASSLFHNTSSFQVLKVIIKFYDSCHQYHHWIVLLCSLQLTVNFLEYIKATFFFNSSFLIILVIFPSLSLITIVSTQWSPIQRLKPKEVQVVRLQ